jgi:hypothetical protein
LLVSAASLEVGKLADRYTSDALGEIGIHRQGAAAVFDFGEWKSSLASRKNDDGTISFFPATAGRNSRHHREDRARLLSKDVYLPDVPWLLPTPVTKSHPFVALKLPAEPEVMSRKSLEFVILL